jgi:hypothetical protein
VVVAAAGAARTPLHVVCLLLHVVLHVLAP